MYLHIHLFPLCTYKLPSVKIVKHPEFQTRISTPKWVARSNCLTWSQFPTWLDSSQIRCQGSFFKSCIKNQVVEITLTPKVTWGFQAIIKHFPLCLLKTFEVQSCFFVSCFLKRLSFSNQRKTLCKCPVMKIQS